MSVAKIIWSTVSTLKFQTYATPPKYSYKLGTLLEVQWFIFSLGVISKYKADAFCLDVLAKHHCLPYLKMSKRYVWNWRVFSALGEVQLCHKMVVLVIDCSLIKKWWCRLYIRDAKKSEQPSHPKKPHSLVSDNSILDFF